MSAFGKSVYVGEYRHQLDAKGRLTIPSKWRFEGDEADVYLALPNPIGCITIYPPKMVQRLEEKVSSVSLGDKQRQKTLMKFFAQADYFGSDTHGRILLSDKLRLHGALDKEVVCVGNFVTFHIWSPGRYEDYLKQDTEGEDEMSRVLCELGL